nr:colicin immunity domain-containing protein [Streptomyces sp. SID14515]
MSGIGWSVVPVPAGSGTDDSLVRRIAAGCRAVGADAVLVAGPEIGSGIRTHLLASADPGLLGQRPPLLLAAPGLGGAVLFPRPGYALVAGTSAFLAGAVPEGVDQGRARFARYVRAVARQWPGTKVPGLELSRLESAARSYPPVHVAWKRPEDVPEGTSTDRQLALMRAFVTGQCTGAEFAIGWLDARRSSQRRGERVRGPLEALLDRVFSLVEGYSVDPRFKEADDLSDEELKDVLVGLLETGGRE